PTTSHPTLTLHDALPILLQETYNVLKPGGLALIRANLYAGPMASHRYRHVFFPWPHLLFPDDVISDWFEKNGQPRRGTAWVNRLDRKSTRLNSSHLGISY